MKEGKAKTQFRITYNQALLNAIQIIEMDIDQYADDFFDLKDSLSDYKYEIERNQDFLNGYHKRFISNG